MGSLTVIDGLIALTIALCSISGPLDGVYVARLEGLFFLGQIRAHSCETIFGGRWSSILETWLAQYSWYFRHVALMLVTSANSRPQRW